MHWYERFTDYFFIFSTLNGTTFERPWPHWGCCFYPCVSDWSWRNLLELGWRWCQFPWELIQMIKEREFISNSSPVRGQASSPSRWTRMVEPRDLPLPDFLPMPKFTVSHPCARRHKMHSCSSFSLLTFLSAPFAFSSFHSGTTYIVQVFRLIDIYLQW